MMSNQGPAPDYQVTLDALQRSARVPLADQIEEQVEPDTAEELSGSDLPGNLRPFAAG